MATRSLLALVLLIAGLPISPLRGQATARTASRQLPLRGEGLLERLRTQVEPPVLMDVSLSPNGSRVFYVEAVLKPGHTERRGGMGYKGLRLYDTLAASYTVRVHDLASGKRSALTAYDQGLESLIVEGSLMPQWSADDKQVAFLEQRDSTWTVVVWQVGATKALTRIPLPRRRIEQTGATARIVHWVWWSARREVWLEVSMEPAEPPVSAHDSLAAADSTWAWFLSRASMEAEAADRQWKDDRRRQQVQRRIFVVDVAHQTVRDLTSEAGSAFAAQATGATWTVRRDRPGVLVSSRDPRHQQDQGFQMWLLHTGNPRGRELTGMRSTLFGLEEAGGPPQPLYTGGPGEIRSVAPLEGGTGYAVLEEDPTLAVWPMRQRWGRIRTVGPGSRRREVAGDPVLLAARLFASDRPAVIYLHEKRHDGGLEPLLGIQEVHLATGRRTRLTPADVAATWADVSDDGRTIAAVLEDVDTPPELAVWTTATRRWRRLTAYGAAYDPPAVGPVERLTWRSKDDRFDVDGFLVKPRDFNAARRYPLLVFLNGGSSGGTYAFMNQFDPRIGVGGALAHIFAAEGYLVLLPNHRHTGGVGFEQARAIVGRYGQQVAYDVEAGVDYLIARGWVDPEQLGIMGHSHGSDEVTYALSHTTRYKAAVINDGSAALPELSVPAFEVPYPRHDKPYGRQGMSRLIGYDPVERVWADPFRIRTPLLLRWGGRRGGSEDGIEKMGNYVYVDGFEGKSQTLKLLYALRRNQVPIEVIIDGDNHDVSGKYQLEFQSRLLQWFDYFLLGKGDDPLPAPASPLDYRVELRAKAQDGVR